MLKNFTIGLLACACLTSLAKAETIYVSDIQFVAIREGQNNSTRAVERGIKSGTPLEVLARDQGYVQVRTPEGNVGWIADYFTTEDMVSRDLLVSLQNQLAEAKSAQANINEALLEARNDNETLSQTVANLTQQKQSLETQLLEVKQLADRARTIVANNEENAYKIESLNQQLAAIQQENLAITSSHEQRWFVIGAGTIFGGILLGLLLPMTRRKKVSNSSW
ncbi:TIGR04211 family SH3 domain-containing protein [Maribrevibacterium harenarium]|uniref:TIGR04211 family SH3 domain-containing protein n=1 Tax=Maribrevibacterium harenarium TaxID=2589817 RepID=A0A501WUA3_9GAMM|nr:TIGR04211 family SH3 domain-containing protein [Maribrevibacterium harenarium]TPE52302.1 TIGR04211 family SH3 domain-containing protein [Maribrevibacterium harenarium]